MISVVLPCYNRGTLLARAIDSVLAQGAYASQVIVVDDGSTDDTRDICAAYGDRIEYVWQENAGASVARNTGVKHARKPWVAFLDSDDYWTASHLARMAQAIEETDGAGCFYFSDLQLGEHDECVTLWRTTNFAPPGPFHLTKDGTNWVFLGRQPMMLQSSVLRRDAWMESGGLDARFRVREDTDLFYRLGIGGKICTVSGVGCVQTSDDVSKVRLTRAVDSHDAVFWEISIMMFRRLLRGWPNLPSKYRRIVRSGLASSHWRLFRLNWSKGNAAKGAWHLLMSGWTDLFFVIRKLLIVYKRSDANRASVLPEFD